VAIGCAPIVALDATDAAETSEGGSAGADATAAPQGPGHTSTVPGTESSSSGVASEDDGSSSGDPDAPPPTRVRYRITIDNTWSLRTHPGGLPEDAHFSWLGGATHDAGVAFWQVGALASPGIVQMAEIGATHLLEVEALAAIDAGRADQSLEWRQWFCPAVTAARDCGEPVVEIDVQRDFPIVTLVSMVGPSPDLFVGVAGLPLFVDGAWVEHHAIDLRPYDGGTRSDHDWTMNGALEDPPLPITAVESFEDHIIGPDSLGTMTLERIE
jgi:hypothetical protein